MTYDALDALEPAPGALRMGRSRPPPVLGSGAIGEGHVAVSSVWLGLGGGSIFSHSSTRIWPIEGSISVPSRETLTSR